MYTDTRDGVYRQLKASVLYTRTTFSLTKLGSTRAVFSLRKGALQVYNCSSYGLSARSFFRLADSLYLFFVTKLYNQPLQALKVLKTPEFMPYVVFIASPPLETLRAHNKNIPIEETKKEVRVSLFGWFHCFFVTRPVKFTSLLFIRNLSEFCSIREIYQGQFV